MSTGGGRIAGDRVDYAELGRIVRAAGDAVLEVYGDAFGVDMKADGSPVTEADRRSEEVLVAGIARLSPGVPIIAEESAGAALDEAAPAAFWLVDPLDGTKEFISRNGEFTVNVALIEDGAPTLGLVLAPALGRLYTAAPGVGSAVEDASGRREISTRAVPGEGVTVVSSRSHGDAEALERFFEGRSIAASITAGSSLKFCVVAAGEADVYPRFGRTMEWDTAAGDAVLRAAGGVVKDLAGTVLRYGKPGFDNPHFVAYGRDES